MMGSEVSQLNGLEIEENAIETTDFWSHYQATIKDSCRYFSLKSDGSVSVFKGKAAAGPLWTLSSPLEKYSNNILKYRHPCIVRYLSSWQQRSTQHLATEFVVPLSHTLSSHTPLQICIGLNNILRALVFLHDQAGMYHNNVSVSAIYVTGDGQWKLGGLQYLCSYSDLTATYLRHARIHRYDRAVDPNEDSHDVTTKVDQYGFAVLVEDVFKRCEDGEVPYLREFKKYCLDYLQHKDPTKRPNLTEVLQHNFFNHEFISIYKFLNFLPLKTEDERNDFFSNLLDTLKHYEKETVAKQLGGLLLSRHTMLDQTAKKDVIPFILKPKNERLPEGEESGFFSLSIYKEHVKPRIMQLFGVRDSQIRMLLLTNFTKFVHVFSHEELSQHILPELLLGIKDTDDNLVASTLICLSELVPILGADTVIGGKRTKLFTDGKPNPKIKSLNNPNKNISLPVKTFQNMHGSENLYNLDINNQMVFEKTLALNERPSPVGGESAEDDNLSLENTNNKQSDDDWSDWENSNRQHTKDRKLIDREIQFTEMLNEERLSENQSSQNMNASISRTLLQNAALKAKTNIVDISELDIKNQKIETKREEEEFDFFADMTPVIEKSSVVSVAQLTLNSDLEISNKLNFVPDENLDESEGWGESWN